MKKLVVIMFLCLIPSTYAQTKSIKRWSVGLDFNLPLNIGDDFLNKGYSENLGFGGEIQYNTKRFFVGLNYKGTSLSNIITPIIGQFDLATMKSNAFFVGFRHFLKTDKLYLEHRLGWGETIIFNRSVNYTYEIGGNMVVVGSRLNYVQNETVNFYLGLDYSYYYFDVVTAPAYDSFYGSAKQIMPMLGVKIHFGKTINLNQSRNVGTKI